MRRLLAAVTTLALSAALALAAPLAAHADGVPFPPIVGTHYMTGALDYVNFVPGEGFIAVGWAVDTHQQSDTAFLSFQVQYPDGHTALLDGGFAGFPRSDVAAAFPQAGPDHGYRIGLGYPMPGLYSICARANFEVIDCAFATMPARNLTGQLESLTLGTDRDGYPALRLRGWTADGFQSNSNHSTPVTYTVLEVGSATPTTGVSYTTTGSSSAERPDIRAAHPSYTGVGGFDDAIRIQEGGEFRVCASTESTVLGCLDLHVNTITRRNSLTVTGDPALGGTLTASDPGWIPALSSDTLTWSRYVTDVGQVATGATGTRSYSPTAADVGHYLTFTENVSAPGAFPSTLSAQVGPVGIPGVSTARIGGADRYEMAVANSQAQFPDSAAGAPVVYIASGEKFPDALAAGPAAAKEGGALLLTFADHLPDSVRAEIARLHPASIVVAGGPATVSDAVLADLGTLAPAERIDGADRYEVSRNLIAHAFPQGAPSVYLVTGANYADALSAGAAAASVGAPVLLTDGGAGAADDTTRAPLVAAGTTAVTVVGGTASVSPGVAGSLGAGISVNRLAGPDRYSGTVVLNRASFQSAGTVYLATGLNFPDGLTGGVHAGADHAPLYLVNGSCVPQDVIADIVSLHASKVVLLGGQATLNADIETLYACP